MPICLCLSKSAAFRATVRPLSGVSRHDLFGHDYVKELEAIRKKYDVPVKYLHAEITESSAIGGIDLFIKAITQFHEAGYLVAMDDFGSGYSSLSVLKDLPVDILKFDLQFLAGEGLGGRGGIILNSAIQMAKCRDICMQSQCPKRK